MARPKKKVDPKQIESLLRLNPTLADAAAFFKVSEDTIYRRLQGLGYESFADARNKNMVHTRLHLIRTALKQAENGNTAMLIFSLKNLCGWKDKQEIEDLKREIVLKVDKEDEKL